MIKETVFKKNLFGGFDRKQVMEYIAYLTSHCSDTATHEEILKLQKHIEELEKQIIQRDNFIKELRQLKPIETVNPVIISLQEIIRNGRKLKKSNEEIDLITSSIQKDIDDKQPKIDNLLKIITSINADIATIRFDLRSISSKLSEIDFENIEVSDKRTEYIKTESVDTTSTSPVKTDETTNDPEQTVIIADNEEDGYPDDENSVYTPLVFDNSDYDSDELINSIDNFFIELEKIADAQIFDLTTLLDNHDKDNATD